MRIVSSKLTVSTKIQTVFKNKINYKNKKTNKALGRYLYLRLSVDREPFLYSLTRLWAQSVFITLKVAGSKMSLNQQKKSEIRQGKTRH